MHKNTNLDISEQMLHPDLLGLLRSNLRGHVLECFACRGSVIVNLLHDLVRLGGETDPSGLGINDDQDTVGAILPDQVIDQDVILMKLRAGVVPSNNSLFSIHFPKNLDIEMITTIE